MADYEDVDVKPKPEKFTLTVITSDGQTALKFKVKPNAPLEKVFTTFEEKMNVDKGTLRFLYHERRLRGTDTPAEIEFEDDDEITAELQQVGGTLVA